MSEERALEYLELETDRQDHVAVVRLHRPERLNALCMGLMSELADLLEELDTDGAIRCIVLTGDEKAFAAGADITEMADAGAVEMHRRNQFATWERIRRIRTPMIAAVSGYALGGGNELAMHCDMIVASESARFGQPEIKIGVMPGAGGTQRLTRAVGKVRAMEMVLTGEPISAEQALEAGLVNRVVPVEVYLDEALKLARTVASRPPVAAMLAKDAVLKAFDTTLEAGLAHERHNFYLLFASEDKKEGMEAFLEKRDPHWKGE